MDYIIDPGRAEHDPELLDLYLNSFNEILRVMIDTKGDIIDVMRIVNIISIIDDKLYELYGNVAILGSGESANIFEDLENAKQILKNTIKSPSI